MSIPLDLMPLPTAPYDVRPDSMPLIIEECRTAIWRAKGNITEAAKILKVSSSRLRSFVSKSPYLTREANESREQLADKAEQIVAEALDDEDASRRDQMARFVLNSGFARQRGWGSGGGTKVNIQNNGGKVVVGWEDGTTFSPQAPETTSAYSGGKTIDHEA